MNGPTGLFVGWLDTADDDGVQVLLTTWPNGTAELAWRREEHHTWSPPIPLESRPLT